MRLMGKAASSHSGALWSFRAQDVVWGAAVAMVVRAWHPMPQTPGAMAMVGGTAAVVGAGTAGTAGTAPKGMGGDGQGPDECGCGKKNLLLLWQPPSVAKLPQPSKARKEGDISAATAGAAGTVSQ